MKSNDTAGIPFTLGLFWEMLKASERTSTPWQIWFFLNGKSDSHERNILINLCLGRRGLSRLWCFILGVFLASTGLWITTITLKDTSNVAAISLSVMILSTFLLIVSSIGHCENKAKVEIFEGKLINYFRNFADNAICWDDIHPAVRIYLTLVKKEMGTEDSSHHKNRGLFDLAIELLQGEDSDTLYKNVYNLIEALEKSQMAEEEADATLLRLVGEFLGYSSKEDSTQ